MFEQLKVLFYLWSVWLVFTCLLTEGLSASRSQKRVFDLNVFSDRKGYGNPSYKLIWSLEKPIRECTKFCNAMEMAMSHI